MYRAQSTTLPFANAFQDFMIDPMTYWGRFFNPQFYFTYNAGDVEVENNVLRKVGSYGKQIGQMMDVLNVLVARLPIDELTPQERYAVDQFRALSKDVARAVAAVKGPAEKGITLADVEHVINGLQSLKQTAPEAHSLLTEWIQNAMDQATKNGASNQGHSERRR